MTLKTTVDRYLEAIMLIDEWEIDAARNVLANCKDDETVIIVDLLSSGDSMEIMEARSMLKNAVAYME